jgi:hypothetical protein
MADRRGTRLAAGATVEGVCRGDREAAGEDDGTGGDPSVEAAHEGEPSLAVDMR